MQIEISDVSTSFTKTAKGGYSQATVQYVDERGATKAFKLMSFSNPAVFEKMKNAKAGEKFEITTRKNDKDFTEWAAADPVSASAAPASGASSGAGGKVLGSQYETRDERNARQRLIVRQSSLANAIEFLNGTEDVNVTQVLDTADRFTQWVYEAPGLAEMPEDIPF